MLSLLAAWFLSMIAAIAHAATMGVANTSCQAGTAAPTGCAGALQGAVTISATVPGGAQVARAEFVIDGALRATDTSYPYAYTWNTMLEENRSHTITVRAYDQPARDTTAPAVSLSLPAA